MRKAKTSKKPASSSRNSKLKLTEIEPTKMLADKDFISKALAQAILDGDEKAFMEIFESHVRAKNIMKLAEEMKVKRSTIYQAIKKDANPSIKTIMKVMRSA